MNIIETFVLVAIMIITFHLLGFWGLVIIGFVIMLLKLSESEPEKQVKERPRDRPCYPHGLVNCPFCHPEKQEKENNDS